jgi:hypothetical protein
VGERLRAPLWQSLRCHPVGLCVREPSLLLRHRRLRHGCPHFRSQAFACPGRRRVERAVSPVSFGRSRLGAPLPTAFSASRMRTTLGPSRSSCCLHRIVSTSDILVVTRRHARPISSSTDALTVTRSSRMVPPALTFEPRTPYHRAGKGKMGGSPRMPSVVSRAREPKPTNRMHANF